MFLALLCQLYKELGGDCADLLATPAAAPAMVVALYTDKGPPEITKPDDIQNLLSILDQLEECLQSKNNNLSDEDNTSLEKVIASLRGTFSS
jgi:hypothetical protein